VSWDFVFFNVLTVGMVGSCNAGHTVVGGPVAVYEMDGCLDGRRWARGQVLLICGRAPIASWLPVTRNRVVLKGQADFDFERFDYHEGLRESFVPVREFFEVHRLRPLEGLPMVTPVSAEVWRQHKERLRALADQRSSEVDIIKAGEGHYRRQTGCLEFVPSQFADDASFRCVAGSMGVPDLLSETG